MNAIAPADAPVEKVRTGSGDAPPLIAHIIQHLRLGGLENGLVNLINHAPPERFRHAVICLSDFSDFRRRLTNPNVPVIALHKRPGKDPGHYVRLFRALRALRPAVVHTRNLAGLDSVVVAALAGVKYRVHGEHGWDMADLHGNRRRYRLYRQLVRPLVNRHVAVSRHIADWLVQSLGIAPSAVAQIYNGVDTTRFAPTTSSRTSSPVRRVMTEDAFVIGCVGRLQTVKNQTLLARAFVSVLAKYPELRSRVRLAIIGDGPLLSEILDILSAGDCADLAWLPGARDDVNELLHAFDVFVLPSLNEGISNTILEAMASGLPVIATRVGGNPELVVNGETGWLVGADNVDELAARLTAYVRQPELAAAHGRAGRERAVTEFSLQRMVDSYLALYEQLPHGRVAPVGV